MIRTITRSSTAACTLPLYIGFLLSEPNATSCLRLENLLNISHDSVNRFLNRESYSPKDMFDESKLTLNLIDGILSVDDSVLDKPYSNYMGYIGYFYSGKHHAVVKGINLITLYYTDRQGNHQPVNFRVYDKSENKTKNDYFLEMLADVGEGFNPPNIQTLKKRGGRKMVLAPEGVQPPADDSGVDMTLLKTLVKAYLWQRQLKSGKYSGMKELCERESITAKYAQLILRLNFLATKLKEAIINGTQPRHLKLADLMNNVPLLWNEQEEIFGLKVLD